MSDTLFIISEIFLILLLVAGSAFFSSAEMALFSLDRAKILSYAKSPLRQRRAVNFLMGDYDRTLVSIILANMFVNSCISMLNDSVIMKTGLPPASAAVISAASAILILLVFGEITPMTIAYIHCTYWSDIVALPVLYLRKMLAPVTFVVDKVCCSVLDSIGRASAPPLSDEEYETYLDSCAEHGAFTGDDTEFIMDALDYSNKDVSDVMIPRSSLGFVRKKDSPDTVKRRFAESEQPLLLVGNRKADDSDSIISARTFFMLDRTKRESWSSPEYAPSAVCIPSGASVMHALRILRRSGNDSALVADEYGGIAGVVSKNIIYAKLAAVTLASHHKNAFRPEHPSENVWLFDGLASLDSVAEVTDWSVPENVRSSTLNGLFCELIDAVPKKGSRAKGHGFSLLALDADGRRATRIEFRLAGKDRVK